MAESKSPPVSDLPSHEQEGARYVGNPVRGMLTARSHETDIGLVELRLYGDGEVSLVVDRNENGRLSEAELRHPISLTSPMVGVSVGTPQAQVDALHDKLRNEAEQITALTRGAFADGHVTRDEWRGILDKAGVTQQNLFPQPMAHDGSAPSVPMADSPVSGKEVPVR